MPQTRVSQEDILIIRIFPEVYGKILGKGNHLEPLEITLRWGHLNPLRIFVKNFENIYHTFSEFGYSEILQLVKMESFYIF